MPTTLLTIEEAAAKIGVSRQQVVKWLNAGRIECVRIGSRRFIDRRHARKPRPIKPGPKPKNV